MRAMKDSSIEWIGEIPEEWEASKLKYISSIYTGNSIKDEEKENTLGKAVDKLAEHGVILNEALKEAIKKLYKYTCSEEGVRHGGTEYVQTDASDAKFMIVTCSAILNYLIEKWEKAKKEVV